MKTYLVGGAVRDTMLGIESHDRDYVVTGAAPEDMLAAGYKQVGADFPVFLHPVTGFEYALARVERRTGLGHQGFTVTADETVSIEDDLLRRDLTVNAMAIEVDENDQPIGKLIDPYGGRRDLEIGLLRHTSEAFSEDPLRVLRVARFSAKLPEFEVSRDTVDLCIEMLERGELEHLSHERIWAETYKALDCEKPSQYFNFLMHVGALDRTPGLWSLKHISSMYVSKVLELTSHLTEHRKNVIIGSLLVGEGAVVNMPFEHDVKGLSTDVVKVARLLKMDWYDFRAEQLHQRLTKSGAMNGQWPFISQALSLVDPSIVELNFQALRRAKTVTAAQFPGLTGKELGDMIKQKQLEVINAR